MRCHWRRSRRQPTATSSRSPADAAAAGTAVPMAAAAATTPGRGCTPARAAGTPARSAAAAPTGHDARSAAFCSDPRVLPDRSAAKKILEFKPSTAVERARGIQSRKAYCNYMRMSGGPKGPPFLLTSEQPLTVIPAWCAIARGRRDPYSAAVLVGKDKTTATLQYNFGRWRWVPAFALGHAHISEAPSSRDGVEVFEAMLHGDGTGRFGRRITVPAAEAADDPGSPGKAVGRMRVLEPIALSLEIVVEGGERCDLSGIEGKPNGLMAASVASLQELEGDDRRLGGDRDQLEEPLGGSELAVFKPEALGFEDAEELLDQPALLVPFDDAPGLFCIRRRMGGEKPPVQRLGTGFRISLTHIDQGQWQAFWQMAQELALRPGQVHRAEAQFERHDAFALLCPR